MTSLAREIAGLRRRNRFSRERVVDPGAEVVVTMTTHGVRLREAWIALESIARGDLRPARLMLWIDDAASFRRLPRELRRLRRRGLEILFTEAYGVHTKYYPYVRSVASPDLPLVTCDDDIVYPADWLSALVKAHRERPADVVCFRAHLIGLDAGGALTPYADWEPARGRSSSFAHFGTSVSGQLLPASVQRALKDGGERFRELAPFADDIWLAACAIAAGVRTSMVGDEPVLFPYIPGSQEAGGLYVVNVLQGGNDPVLARVLGSAHLAAIARDLAADPA